MSTWERPHKLPSFGEQRISSIMRWLLISISVLASFLLTRVSHSDYLILTFLIFPIVVAWGYYHVISNWNFHIEIARFLGSSDVRVEKGLNYARASWNEHYGLYPHLLPLRRTWTTTLGVAFLGLSVPFGVCMTFVFLILNIQEHARWGKTYDITDIFFFSVGGAVGISLSFLFLRKLGAFILRCHISKNHSDLWNDGYTVLGRVMSK